MELDRKDLKIQALLEKVSSLTTNYENQVADLRVNLTILEKEKTDLQSRLQEYENGESGEAVQEETSS